jgi:PAS domain S-box-containing protein
MDIRKKSLVILTGIVLANIVILICLSSTLILDSYKTLESDHVRDSMDLALKNVNSEITSLDSTVKDWGPWDDTYAFVNGEKPHYIESNLVPGTYEALYLNFIIITNTRGEIVYGRGFDLKKNEFTPLRQDLIAALSDTTSPLHNQNPNITVSGLLNLPEGIAIISSVPIIKSDFSGQPRGSIIMGRYLDAAETMWLAHDNNRLKISVVPINGSSLSTQEQSVLIGSGDTGVLTRPLNDEIVEGDVILKDIYGYDTFLFTVQMPRDIYHQGFRTVLLFVFFQLVILFGVSLLIIWLIDSQVLRRLTTINQEIAAITEQQTPASRITNGGHDEISRLVDALNRMLDQIDTSQTALVESEKRFRELAEQFPEIMLEVDTQGIPTFVNNAAYPIFVYISGEQEKRGSIFELIAPEDRERLRDIFSRVLQGESLNGNEYVATKKDGSRFAAILYTSPISNNKKITGVRIFAVDISERKRMEDSLRRINEKMSLLSSITRHDILNQLSALRGYIYLSHECLDDTKTLLTFLEKEDAIALTIEYQIQFMKDYEDIGASAPVWENVSESIQKATARLPMRNITVETDRTDCEIFADPLAEKVFYNLIDNALRYGRDGMKTIQISSSESDKGLTIVCEDDGVGVPAEDKERIFTRGFGKHTGLGLFLSREIFLITGITITENGTPGKGARFAILVPRGKYRFVGTGEK